MKKATETNTLGLFGPTHLQHTLSAPVTFDGVGLHSGAPVRMTLHPAPAHSGLVFVRADVHGKRNDIPARYDAVTATTLGTTLTNEAGVQVQTVEHLLAALAGLGVDNARIVLDGPEVPIMDGSAHPFVEAITTTGLRTQSAPRRVLEIRKTVRVEEGASVVELRPAAHYHLEVAIEFAHRAIARQTYHMDVNAASFARFIAAARTFGFAEDVEKLRAMGLARGGSLDNAIVLNRDGIMNPEGLRFDDEFVRHKLLDCIGDFALAGGTLTAHIMAERPGHGINNHVLRAVFADSSAYRWVDAQPTNAYAAPRLAMPARNTAPAPVLHGGALPAFG